MAEFLIACRLLWKRKDANLLLLLEVLLSVITLAQAFVFVMDHFDKVRAVNELPLQQTMILHTFDYYTPQVAEASLRTSPLLDGLGTVRVGTVYEKSTICNLAVYHPDLY